MADSRKCVVALGSNLGDRMSQLSLAVFQLAETLLHHMTLSGVYETLPEGITDQPRFYNAVVTGFSGIGPGDLLDQLKSLEIKLGRLTSVQNGPRAIDLDLIAIEDLVYTSDKLAVPHPRLTEREFVLQPFCEIWPDWTHPILNLSTSELLARLSKRKPFSAIRIGPILPSIRIQ